MLHVSRLVILFLLIQIPGDHGQNSVLWTLINDGLLVDGAKVVLPAPTLPDTQTAETARAALKSVVGDDRALQEFLRNSVTAPFILKTRDVKADHAIVRVADLWFIVHARLEELDLDRAMSLAKDQATEVANMRVEMKVLDERDLGEQKVERLPGDEHRKEWYTHTSSRLLDRILVEETSHVIASRSSDSVVIAARTDSSFDESLRFPNRWATLTRKGNTDSRGPDRRYPGGASYSKMTRLPDRPGVLLVEAHLAYVEPIEWFQGNPILRSKFGVIAQDQVRRLRREIDKTKSTR